MEEVDSPPVVEAKEAAKAPPRDRNTPLVSIDIGKRPARTVGKPAKATKLLTLLALNPVEFYDRVRAILETKARRRWPTTARYSPVAWEEVVKQVGEVFRPAETWSQEASAFLQTRRELEERLARLEDVPFPTRFDGDPVLARLGYFLTRVLRPQVVIETGVAFGISSGFILAALERNGGGRLISIDLPPLGVSARVTGAIVPDRLRERWTLIRGVSTRVLPSVLRDLPPVGLFVHDSLFTQRNACEEYERVLPHLASHSAIVANRVDLSDAFALLTEEAKPAAHCTIAAEQKPGEMIGVALFSDGPSLAGGGKLLRKPVMREVIPAYSDRMG